MATQTAGICSTETCSNPLRARGLCDNCYKKAQRRGALPPRQRWVNPVDIRHPLYAAWSRMRNRCRNKNSPDYKDYGGRGISICKEWEDFPVFYADMANTYQEGLLLDRINNEGDYSASNCRWATPAESAQNRRSTKLDERKVALIREAYRAKPPEESIDSFNARIALLFDIAPNTVFNITSNRQWI